MPAKENEINLPILDLHMNGIMNVSSLMFVLSKFIHFYFPHRQSCQLWTKQFYSFLPSGFISPDPSGSGWLELAGLGSFPSPRPFSSDKPQLVRHWLASFPCNQALLRRTECSGVLQSPLFPLPEASPRGDSSLVFPVGTGWAHRGKPYHFVGRAARCP